MCSQRLLNRRRVFIKYASSFTDMFGVWDSVLICTKVCIQGEKADLCKKVTNVLVQRKYF